MTPKSCSVVVEGDRNKLETKSLRAFFHAMIQIRKHSGDRTELLPLFQLADESESEIQSYCMLGEVLVALDDEMIVGMAQVEKDGDTVQIISLAVIEVRQRQGIGSRLITAAQKYCSQVEGNRLIVCTGAWEADNIDFYSNRGFRLFHVERGFFTPEKGYAELGDQVQFEIEV